MHVQKNLCLFNKLVSDRKKSQQSSFSESTSTPSCKLRTLEYIPIPRYHGISKSGKRENDIHSYDPS